MDDPCGTPHPDFDASKPRFRVYLREVRFDTPPDMTHELTVVDRKYQDSEGFAIDAIACGGNWEDAFAQAGEFIDRALAADHCIF